MTEVFIMNSFRASGEEPTRVKIMKDKNTGDAAGYCFVHFDSEETARTVLHKLNGKVTVESYHGIVQNRDLRFIKCGDCR